jgi:hypothetical protein
LTATRAMSMATRFVSGDMTSEARPARFSAIVHPA